MKRGIYIVANDRVIEEAIALLNSIRLYDPDVPVIMIPYNEQYQAIGQLLGEQYGVKIYENLEFLERLSQNLYNIFGEGFFANPNHLRKEACWFGELDEFLYIDVDVIVFEKIIDNLKYLQEYDFLCCDYQYKVGIKNIFNSKLIEENIFNELELQDTFNSGFWCSKNNLFSEQELYETFAECAAHPEYFDFSQKTTDQPILNYMVLKRIKRRFNIVRREGKAPGSWAGSPHFKRQGNVLIDPNLDRSLQYLHWAGFAIQPGCPYWDIWQYYRYLNSTPPEITELVSERKNIWQLIKEKFEPIK
jgi:hypothetical protein